MGPTVKRLPGEQIRIEVRPGTEPADLIEELQQGITITLIETPGAAPGFGLMRQRS